MEPSNNRGRELGEKRADSQSRPISPILFRPPWYLVNPAWKNVSDLRADPAAEALDAEEFIPRFDSIRVRPKDRRPVRLVNGMPAVSVPRQHLLWDFAVHARRARGRAVPTMLEVQDAADEAGLPHWVVCTYFHQLLVMLGEHVPHHILKGVEYTSPVPRPGENDDETHPPKPAYTHGKPVVSRKFQAALHRQGLETARRFGAMVTCEEDIHRACRLTGLPFNAVCHYYHVYGERYHVQMPAFVARAVEAGARHGDSARGTAPVPLRAVRAASQRVQPPGGMRMQFASDRAAESEAHPPPADADPMPAHTAAGSGGNAAAADTTGAPATTGFAAPTSLPGPAPATASGGAQSGEEVGTRGAASGAASPTRARGQGPPSPHTGEGEGASEAASRGAGADAAAASGTLQRTEYVDVHILRPLYGAVPSIKDVTILMPKSVNQSRVLRSFYRCLIQYSFPATVALDRKKVQSRRDAEVVRLKKSLLRQYLAGLPSRAPETGVASPPLATGPLQTQPQLHPAVQPTAQPQTHAAQAEAQPQAPAPRQLPTAPAGEEAPEGGQAQPEEQQQPAGSETQPGQGPRAPSGKAPGAGADASTVAEAATTTAPQQADTSEGGDASAGHEERGRTESNAPALSQEQAPPPLAPVAPATDTAPGAGGARAEEAPPTRPADAPVEAGEAAAPAEPVGGRAWEGEILAPAPARAPAPMPAPAPRHPSHGQAHRPEAGQRRGPGGQGGVEESEVWVQCNWCDKWRRLPTWVDEKALPTLWACSMNRWDLDRAHCSAPQEKTPDEEEEDGSLMGHAGARAWASAGRGQQEVGPATRHGRGVAPAGSQPQAERDAGEADGDYASDETTVWDIVDDEADEVEVEGVAWVLASMYRQRGFRKRPRPRAASPPQRWVRCDNTVCRKWRRVPADQRLPRGRWFCMMNSLDPLRASCSAAEETFGLMERRDVEEEDVDGMVALGLGGAAAQRAVEDKRVARTRGVSSSMASMAAVASAMQDSVAAGGAAQAFNGFGGNGQASRGGIGRGRGRGGASRASSRGGADHGAGRLAMAAKKPMRQQQPPLYPQQQQTQQQQRGGRRPQASRPEPARRVSGRRRRRMARSYVALGEGLMEGEDEEDEEDDVGEGAPRPSSAAGQQQRRVDDAVPHNLAAAEAGEDDSGWDEKRGSRRRPGTRSSSRASKKSGDEDMVEFDEDMVGKRVRVQCVTGDDTMVLEEGVVVQYDTARDLHAVALDSAPQQQPQWFSLPAFMVGAPLDANEPG